LSLTGAGDDESGSEELGEGAADQAPAAVAAEPQAYKRPESVLVVVFTRGGEFLLLRRTRPNDFWQSVTGSLKAGEGIRAAAARELREETGLRVSPSGLIDLRHSERFSILPAWRSRYAPGAHYNREHWFALALPGRRLVELDRQEHLEYRWLTAAQAAFRATSWTNRNAILWLAQFYWCLP